MKLPPPFESSFAKAKPTSCKQYAFCRYFKCDLFLFKKQARQSIVDKKFVFGRVVYNYSMAETTKRALEASLKKLLLEKPLDKITVTDITQDCGISRMTFYYHFKDLYDLVEWSCQEDASQALAGNRTANTWQTGFLAIFREVRANKPFIMNVYHCVSRERVEQYLYDITYDLLITVVQEQSQGLQVRTEDKQFIATLYKYAFVGIMLDWIAHDMQQDEQELVSHISKVLEGDFVRALHRFAY